MKYCIAMAVLLAGAALVVHAAPQDDPAQAKQIVTQVCAACHGADGNSTDPAYPSLAGQGAYYLYEQLNKFKAQGGKRASGVMSAMALRLNDDEMRGVADYFAQQTPKPAAAPDQALAEQGEAIYRGGIAARNVSACASCHGFDGSGLPPEFPRLAGQHTRYLAKQLHEFSSGRRASNSNAMMRVLAHKLSDKEIIAVARYITGMR